MLSRRPRGRRSSVKDGGTWRFDRHGKPWRGDVGMAGGVKFARAQQAYFYWRGERCLVRAWCCTGGFAAARNAAGVVSAPLGVDRYNGQ